MVHVLTTKMRVSTRTVLAVAVSLGIAFLILTGRYAWSWTHNEDYKNGLYYARFQLAHWLDQNLPHSAVLASFNAGQFGYFSNRQVINLDGLVNSFEYFRSVKQGTVSLLQYLSENEVDYFVDYSVPSEIWSISEQVHAVEVGEQRYTLYVLKLPRNGTFEN
jgi:hypothetical protein